MITEPSGIATLIMVVVGPLLLGAAFLYGVLSYRRRSARLKQEGDKETREIYKTRDV